VNRNLAIFLLFQFTLIACDKEIVEISERRFLDDPVIEIPRIEIEKSDPLLSTNQQGLMYYKDQPFSGFVFVKHPNSILKSKNGYFDGMHEGKSLTYFDNGKLASERSYKSGKKHGVHKGWYLDGQLRFEYIFINGKSEGNHKVWYEDGSLFKDFNFKNGRAFGSQKVWRKDGKIRANYVIRENGKKYGLSGLRRCAKIDTQTQNIDPYTGTEE